MKITEYAEPIFDELQMPCFVVTCDKGEVLYLNPAMRDMLSLDSDKEVLGKHLYDVIPKDENEQNSLQFIDTMGEERYYSPALMSNFLISYRPVFFEAETFCLCKYYKEKNVTSQAITFEEAMNTCMLIFQQSFDDIVPSFMKLLCEFYQSERAFVYHVNQKTREITCDFQWCTDPDYEKNLKDKVLDNSEFLFQWLEERNDLGILDEDRRLANFDKNSLSGQILDGLSLENLTINVIENDKHEVTGAVGISNRKMSYLDYRLLNAITHFVIQDMNKISMEETLYNVTRKDSLTGFSGRNSYLERMAMELVHPSESLGVVFINVNGLKRVNEEIGCLQGDELIKRSAIKVKKFFGYDFYRIAGDEFVGLVPNITKETFESKVITLQKKLIEEENYDFSIGYSWGGSKSNFQKLVSEADTMMYINKQKYYSTQNPTLNHSGDNTLSNLLSYLKNGEFVVYLQSQIELSTGNIKGAEALIRRFDKTSNKIIFPDEFIPLYEKNLSYVILICLW